MWRAPSVSTEGPRRRSRAVYRRRRFVAGLGAVALIGVIWAVAASGGGSSKLSPHRPAPPGPAKSVVAGRSARPVGPPAIEAGLVPWKLATPLSRMVALAGNGTNLVLLGGLRSDQTSDSGVYDLDTATGALTQVADMADAVHDAAGAVVAGRAVVFGGGSSSTMPTVQSMAVPGGAAPGSLPVTQATARLPTARSDSAAVTIGPTAYVVGGYDGTNPTPQVLATTDGTTFSSVADLAVPVRYPAVAAIGQDIYIFGGELVEAGSAADGQPTDIIQVVQPAQHIARVIGHMPIPLEAAAAFQLDGQIYLAGGDTTQAARSTTGAGSTQLGGWANAPGTPASPGTSTVGTIWAFDPGTAQMFVAGDLQVPSAHAGLAVVSGRAWLIGGEAGGNSLGTVQALQPNPAFGSAGGPGAGSPYYGDRLLVADRGNNRLLLLDDTTRVIWAYPNATTPADPLRFYFPDDAFFIRHGHAIISNQEQNETIIEIAYPSGQVTWSYGHPKQSGTAPGYLNEPDDAYLLPDGQITVADAQNCRVLVINPGGTVAHQIGTDGACVHNPPTSMGSPNGDTPLWDGNLLVSEINGSWVSEYTPTGALVWTVHLPIAYPSDPQQLDATATHNTDRYLIADYSSPGEVLQFNRQGEILSTYLVASGPGALNHPSLVEKLPNGIYMINDDYNDRMVAIDPATGAIVWQYGITSQPGQAPGMLNTPDGFDVLAPDGTTPTHPQTG